MKKYLAHDPVNNEWDLFETIEEAREALTEFFLYGDEGYHPDAESFEIFELVETVKLTTTDEKSNYKYESEDAAIEANDQEAIDDENFWPHSSDFEEVCKHEFVRVP